MKCNECGSSNPKEAVFCNKCGAKLGVFCPNCGNEVEKGDKFCKKCGNSLKQSKKGKPSAAQTPSVPDESKPIPPKKQIKIPVWILIVIGLIVVACILVAVFGEISFTAGPIFPKETSAPEATITPIIVPTATPKATATLAVTPTPVLDPVKVNILCEQGSLQYVHEHQPVTVGGTLDATTEEELQELMDSVDFSSIFDNEEIAPLLKYFVPYYDETTGYYTADFGVTVDPLSVGAHSSETTITFSKNMTIRGEPIGPGTEFEAATFICPIIVGAPLPSWKVVSSTDFSSDQNLFSDKDEQGENMNYTTREGENGVYRIKMDVLRDDNTYYEFAYSNLPISDSSPDFLANFTVDLKQFAKDAQYGFVFRYDSDLEEGYKLLIDPISKKIQFYEISQMNMNGAVIFEGVADLINQSGKNEITFLAKEGTYILWLNNSWIFFLEDSTVLEPGTNYLEFQAQGKGETVFELDDFISWSPGN